MLHVNSFRVDNLHLAGLKHGLTVEECLEDTLMYLDIVAPHYWWTQLAELEPDALITGECRNVALKRQLDEREFVLDDFSYEHLDDHEIQFELPESEDEEYVTVISESAYTMLNRVIGMLNAYRELYFDCTVSKYLTTADCKKTREKLWWQIIQLLPSSYNESKTLTISYKELKELYSRAVGAEWNDLWQWVVQKLPCSSYITGEIANPS